MAREVTTGREPPAGGFRRVGRYHQGMTSLLPTTTITREVAPDRVTTDDGDHDRFAHYCRKEDVMRALVTGEAITALCGKKWVPSRDPEKYPICPTCVERKAAGMTL